MSLVKISIESKNNRSFLIYLNPFIGESDNLGVLIGLYDKELDTLRLFARYYVE